MAKRPQIGREYKIIWQDHFTTTDKSPEEAIKQNVTMTSWGRCIAITPTHIILAQNWEDDVSSNNDNIHILKKCILKFKELR